ncbi:MAG: hypothetical protein ACI870_000620 [Crocinitomicaceae bacterium]|jgi:hypothetical protein
MKFLHTKNILAVIVIAFAFAGQHSSAQVVGNYHYDGSGQYQESLPYNGNDYVYPPYQYNNQNSFGDNDKAAQIAQLIEIVMQLQAQLNSQSFGNNNFTDFGFVNNRNNGAYTFTDISGSTTASNNNDDEPRAETQRARNIKEYSAELRGDVDMNDFNNGIVFFVWGEDEDDVEDVEDENRYQDIDENGEDLQKNDLRTNFDKNANFELDVYGLDNDTDIYFSMCVQYEDEDDDDTIECGNVRNFETDN